MKENMLYEPGGGRLRETGPPVAVFIRFTSESSPAESGAGRFAAPWIVIPPLNGGCCFNGAPLPAPAPGAPPRTTPRTAPRAAPAPRAVAGPPRPRPAGVVTGAVTGGAEDEATTLEAGLPTDGTEGFRGSPAFAEPLAGVGAMDAAEGEEVTEGLGGGGALAGRGTILKSCAIIPCVFHA